MHRVKNSALIEATPEAVWMVLTDPTMVPKLYPDVVSVVVDPPGAIRLGTKFHVVGKAGKKRIEIFTETVEIIPMRKIRNEGMQKGVFKVFNQEITMEPSPLGIVVHTSFEYEISMGYVGRIFNIVILERLVQENLRAYTGKLKELSELTSIPLPENQV